jgi:hypothetical protein
MLKMMEMAERASMLDNIRLSNMTLNAFKYSIRNTIVTWRIVISDAMNPILVTSCPVERDSERDLET